MYKGEAGWRWTKDLWDKTIGQKSWKKSWVPSRSVPNSIACRWYGISWRRKKTGFSPGTLSYKQTIRTTSPQNFHEICQQTYIFCTQSQVLENSQRRKHISPPPPRWPASSRHSPRCGTRSDGSVSGRPPCTAGRTPRFSSSPARSCWTAPSSRDASVSWTWQRQCRSCKRL